MKYLNQEVKRDLKEFEANYIKKLTSSPADVLRIYERERSSWNLILIQHKSESYPYLLSIPKLENSCSPSFYGTIEHAKQYNTFINL